MDETLLNMFQQYLYRGDTMKNTTWFFRPGGGARVDQPNHDRPISDSIYLVPRRPLPPEAYAEERYVQNQSEGTSGADAVSQGVEATQKSRDVTAAEINQRVVQGANRWQLEILYKNAVLKRPLMSKIFDLLRQNLTTPRMVRILDDTEGTPIDLRSLLRPIDIIIEDQMQGFTQAEKLQEIDRLVNLSKPDTAFGPWLKAREILIEMLRSTRTLRRNTAKFVKTQEEYDQELQKMGAAPGAGPGAVPNAASPPGALPPGAPGIGPGAPGLGNAAGQAPEGLALSSGSNVEEI